MRYPRRVRVVYSDGAEEVPAAEEQASEETPEPASEEPTAEAEEPTQADATASASPESTDTTEETD